MREGRTERMIDAFYGNNYAPGQAVGGVVCVGHRGGVNSGCRKRSSLRRRSQRSRFYRFVRVQLIP